MNNEWLNKEDEGSEWQYKFGIGVTGDVQTSEMDKLTKEINSLIDRELSKRLDKTCAEKLEEPPMEKPEPDWKSQRDEALLEAASLREQLQAKDFNWKDKYTSDTLFDQLLELIPAENHEKAETLVNAIVVEVVNYSAGYESPHVQTWF